VQWNGVVDDTKTAIAHTLDQVGFRLKQMRAQRGVTLTALSEATGISKSTLSRLETGQRRASLSSSEKSGAPAVVAAGPGFITPGPGTPSSRLESSQPVQVALKSTTPTPTSAG
jgi:DNA-binding XRE family transcriptional regulator